MALWPPKQLADILLLLCSHRYTDEDLQHMRKVVSYNKRHLAQEEKMKETKSKEELEQTKSVKSLRNWGHDPLKNM